MTTDKQLTQLNGAYVSLKEYVEAKLTAMEKATDLQQQVYSERFAGVNEFRQALDDYVKSLVPRAEYEVKHQALEEAINSLKEYRAELKGMASNSEVNRVTWLAIFSMLLSVVFFIVEIAGKI